MRRPVALALGVVLVVVVLGSGALGARLAGVGPFHPATLGAPHYVDETVASGLHHVYGGGDTAMIGGGLAVFDCDHDGRPDIFVAGGDHPAALFRNVSTRGGSLAFTQVQSPVTDLTGVMGAYPIDIGGDGNPDLAVLRVGGVDLLRGLGGCRFERANDAWGFQQPTGWEMAFSASWEGSNRLPTLAVGSYVGLDATGTETYRCAPPLLFRPVAGGSGYGTPIPLAPGYCPLSMLFSDWDGSGRRDLRIANDRHYYDAFSADQGEEQLWRIAPGEAPRAYTAADGWRQLQVWGMGIASQDLNGDGLPEIYITSQNDNKLQTLAIGPAQPTYRDIALKSGVIGTRPVNGGDPLPSTAWHPEFEDVNNDGIMDLYVSKGNIDQMPDYASRDPSNLYIGQPGGTFTEQAAAAGIINYDHSRGAALVDLNGDGLLDLVEVKVNAPMLVFRNVGAGTAAAPQAMGHWLGVSLQEADGNSDAIGAVIEVRAGALDVRREVVVGGGHISGQLGPTHFGLGDATSAEVRVQWPDGTWGPWQTTAADRAVTVTREPSAITEDPAFTP
ncbi:MAG: CRTAC1 family protein [Candidatus Limnocylindrales bacterium]